jgi:hypothetical protein
MRMPVHVGVRVLVVVVVSMLVVVVVPSVRMIRIMCMVVVVLMSVFAPRIVSLGHARCILLAVGEGPALMLSRLRRRRGRALT